MKVCIVRGEYGIRTLYISFEKEHWLTVYAWENPAEETEYEVIIDGANIEAEELTEQQFHELVREAEQR